MNADAGAGVGSGVGAGVSTVASIGIGPDAGASLGVGIGNVLWRLAWWRRPCATESMRESIGGGNAIRGIPLEEATYDVDRDGGETKGGVLKNS